MIQTQQPSRTICRVQELKAETHNGWKWVFLQHAPENGGPAQYSIEYSRTDGSTNEYFSCSDKEECEERWDDVTFLIDQAAKLPS